MSVRPPLKLRDIWITTIRIVAIGILLVGVSMGAIQRYFPLTAGQVLGADVDAELKLAFLGLFNKSLDVLLVSSVEYTASLILTIWMAKSRTSYAANTAIGVMFADFGLKDELTKPWMTIASFVTRYRRSRFKWNWKSFWRCLLCLCISLSVMLQGLAINTVAIPKKRWYPNWSHGWGHLREQDRKMMTIEYPKVFVQEVNWYNLLGVGQANVGIEGVGYAPWDWGLGLSASLSFVGLTHLFSTVEKPQKTWQQLYRTELDGDSSPRWTALYTRFNHPNQPIETISADSDQLLGVYNWLKEIGHQPSKSSVGWTGNLTVVVPALNTICISTAALNSDQPQSNSSFHVTIPNDNKTGVPMFAIELGSVPSMNFTGVKCTSIFRQALFPVDFWILDTQSADLSFNGYGQDWYKNVTYEATIPSDYGIISALANQTRDSLLSMVGLTPAIKLLPQFLFLSRKLQQIDPAIKTEAAGLSVIVGVLLQNMVSMGNKVRPSLPSVLPSDPTQRIKSYPVQWQLYGSGPRLAWEWVTVVILLIVLASFFISMYLTLRYWMSPGPWTELDGMMMLAQTSPPLDDIGDETKAQNKAYWVEKNPQDKLVLQSKVVVVFHHAATSAATVPPMPSNNSPANTGGIP